MSQTTITLSRFAAEELEHKLHIAEGEASEGSEGWAEKAAALRALWDRAELVSGNRLTVTIKSRDEAIAFCEEMANAADIFVDTRESRVVLDQIGRIEIDFDLVILDSSLVSRRYDSTPYDQLLVDGVVVAETRHIDLTA